MLPGAVAGWSFGALTDRFGAGRIAVTGLLLSAAASVAGGFSTSFGMLVALRVVEGAGYSFTIIAGTVLVTEAMPARSVLPLSIWSSFAPIGFALGQWAGAFAPPDAPLPIIGMVHAAILLATALALFWVAPPATQRVLGGSSWIVIRHPPALRTAFAFGATCGVIIAAVALTPVVLASRTGMSVAQVASLTALASLPGLVGRIAPGWLLERGIAPFAIFLSASAVAAASIVGTFAVPLWPALALYLVFQIAAGALPGLLSAMMQQVVPAGQFGSFSGVCSQFVNVGNLAGPPLALATYAAAGIGAAVTLLIGLLAAAVLAIAGVGVYRRSLGEALR